MRGANGVGPASALVAALLAALLVAGCSSGDDTGSGPPTTLAPIATAPSTAPTTTTTGPPVVLPASFPKGKVPLPQGARLAIAAVVTVPQSSIPGWTLTYESAGPVSDLARAYRAELKAAGFEKQLDRAGKGGARRGEINFMAWTDTWTVTCVGSSRAGVGTLVVGVSPHRTLADIQELPGD